ncbi:hypothetical protein [Streptomyces sp. NPDC050704]|uniref:hypothetical protein n=1 Tax=Streptomyces sp. NPDC050704 TaxID=3157219 RepID=UPI0034308672
MRTPVSAISAATGAAVIALLSVPATAFTATAEGTTERSTSYVATGSVFQEALAEGAVVGTQDYCETGPNEPGRC